MRAGSAVGPGAVVRAMLLAAMASLAGLSGCREAPISFAAVPGPALSDDLGLAERRAGRELTPAEYEAFIAAHDVYLEAWRETIRGEAEPIARDVRGVDPEELRKDAVRIRNLMGRQQAVLGRLAGLDRDLAGAIAGIGPGTAAIAEAFVARRSLDRVNTILETDGDAALADLRDTAERILVHPEFDDLPPETVAAIDLILDRHDGLAVPRRERVGEAAIELTLDWRTLEDASPPADSLIDPSIKGDARVNARNRIAFERLAQARGRLATALNRLAELDDATLVVLDGADRRFAESVGHAVLRQRVRDSGIGIRIRRMALLARVASQVPELDDATRQQLARSRERFLGQDLQRLRDLLVILREGLVPGVFEPGGPGAGGRRLERIRRIENERERSLAEFRTLLERLVPSELLDSLDSLLDLDPAEFRVALSRITGEVRSSRLAREVDDDLLNPQPRQSPSSDSGVEDEGPDGDRPREAAVFMGRPIAPGDLSRLADRCGIEGPVPQAWIDVTVADAERRRPIEKEESATFERDLRRAVSAVMDGDSAERTSQSIRTVFATVDRIRARQVEEDAALIDALVASVGPPIPPVEAAFWKLERTESSGRVRWSQIPGVDGLALPREARVDPALLVGSLDLPRPARALLLELVAEYGDRVAAEDFRRAAVEAVRRMFTTAVEAQVAGRRIDDEEPEWRAELGRMRASAVAEAGRVVAIRRAILDRLARSLSREDSRRLHEAHFAATYPGILDLRDPLSLALEELRRDTAFDDRAYPAILVALDQRDEARDRALAGLREWTRTEAADRVDGAIRGKDFSKGDPRCAFLLALRREADVRAVRRIRVLFDDPARVRHPLVAESPRPPHRPLDRIRVYE